MSIGQTEQQDGGDHAFMQNTDVDSRRQNYQIGFNTSPWRRMSFTTQFKKRISDTDYNDHGQQDDTAGYPGFIRRQNLDTDELLTKLVVNPSKWLKTTLSYRLVSTKYSTTTDSSPDENGSPGGEITSGKNDGQIFSLGAVVTPHSRLYFASAISYNKSRTSTADNGNASVVPYRGDTYSIITSANFALNKSTDLQATYAYSDANFSQHNFEGVPAGVDYTRHVVGFGIAKKWTDYMSTSLRYSYYQYSEPSSGNKNNYVANGIFATLTLRWP